MSKITKFFIILIISIVVIFGFYLYKLHSLSLLGNKIYEYRCINVNPHLISYKNSFLKFADFANNPNKLSKEEAFGFYDGYIFEMRAYIPEETKWLKMQQKYMNRWDYKLFLPRYFKIPFELETKMFEAYRDDAQYMVDIFDKKLTFEQINTNYPEPRQRRDKYNQLLFDFFNKFSEINDWRKIFTQVTSPKGCTKENETIPDTSGSIEWGNKAPTSFPPQIKDIDPSVSS